MFQSIQTTSLNSHHLHAAVSEAFDSFFALLLSISWFAPIQEEEDLQSEVTVRRWSSLPPYSDQQCGFGGAEIRDGCCGGDRV